MAKKKRGLGKGLDALLSFDQPVSEVSVFQHSEDVAVDENEDFQSCNTSADKEPTQASKAAAEQNSPPSLNQVQYLPIEFLECGQFQPRQQFDQEKLAELAQSIKQQGMMQPIVVRSMAHQRYEIIAGERRWRASQLAGLDKVPCLLKALSDETALVMALIENMQREDLNPIEEAMGLKRLQEEFDLTHQQIADSVGKSRVAVTNLLRLNNLSESVKSLLMVGDLEMGHGRALLSLPEGQQLPMARTVMQKQLSVRETENLVKVTLAEKGPKKEIPTDPNLVKLQTGLSEKLGAKVKIQHASSGKGKLLIHYTSLDELDGILAHIQ